MMTVIWDPGLDPCTHQHHEKPVWEYPKIGGTLFWGPYFNKDLTISGTILGSLFSETPIWPRLIILTALTVLQVGSTLLTLAVPEYWLKRPFANSMGVQGFMGGLHDVGALIRGIAFSAVQYGIPK